MAKPVSQRGFKLKSETMIYEITDKGEEYIIIAPDTFIAQFPHIHIKADNGEIKAVSVSTVQFRGAIEIGELGTIYSNSPEEITRQNLKQAEIIYKFVKRKLKVDEKLKEYIPQFSHESEISLFNILGIDSEADLEARLK